mmetsp:Transcript_43452/g.109123  ORF Transcript_43452/g.109123 Transcript_43452/m.109123 type:complete len:757 (+) Transcript_43452:112-2382(+)
MTSIRVLSRRIPGEYAQLVTDAEAVAEDRLTESPGPPLRDSRGCGVAMSLGILTCLLVSAAYAVVLVAGFSHSPPGAVGSRVDADQLQQHQPNVLSDTGMDGGDSSSSNNSALDVVVMGGFVINTFLNVKYTERADSNYSINGKSTYWNPSGDYYVYWCKWSHRWDIAWSDVFQEIQTEGDCYYTGRGPEGVPSLDPNVSTGWTEYDQETRKMVPCKNAGVLIHTSARNANTEMEKPAEDTDHHVHDHDVGRRIVIMGRFLTNPELNAQFIERSTPNSTVADHRTYWTPSADYFLYWCRAEERWVIAWRAVFEAIQQKDQCDYTAVAPANVQKIDDPKLSGNWSEYSEEEGRLLFRPHAGVDIFSSHAELNERNNTQREFHPFKKWPHCSFEEFMRGPRNQGDSCNNCWAMAVASALQMRVCINNQSFSGSRAALSAGYLTSCAMDAWKGQNGCEEGNPTVALRWISTNGVPTGGDGSNSQTCVPDFQNGISLMKSTYTYQGNMITPPACPTNCTVHSYPRDLQDDLFVLAGLNETWETTSFESATLAINTSGPIAMSFAVYEDFLSYKSGQIYNRSSDKFLFDHVVNAFGFGPDYIVALNSWGSAFGDVGRFMIYKQWIKSYTIPGPLLKRSPAAKYPLPLPKAEKHAAVFFQGFNNSALNDRYQEMGKYNVSGNFTFWNSFLTNFVYWCKSSKRWTITTRSNWAKVSEGECWWSAQAPEDLDIFDWPSNQSWYEYNGSTLVLQPGAQIVRLSYL